ncbi:MAG: hypothetical protein ACYTG6_15320 [Planctomycetota bacterium]|jgi:hypothetical protein
MTRSSIPRRLAVSPPILARPHRLRGLGSVRVQGTGELAFRLGGSGRIDVKQLQETTFHFEPAGDAAAHGVRRFPGPDTLVIIAARGTLTLTGDRIDVSFRDGRVDLEARGDFQVALEGRGAWDAPDGARRTWGLRPERVDLHPGG